MVILLELETDFHILKPFVSKDERVKLEYPRSCSQLVLI